MSHRFILNHKVANVHLDDLNQVKNVHYLYWTQDSLTNHNRFA